MDGQRWKVGELAKSAGLTVRTLHHFDKIGLLRPTERSEAGHRLYTSGDVRQLYRILALRQLGMSLGEIAESLAGDVDDLQAAVSRQLELVKEQIRAQQEIRRRLTGILRSLRQPDGPSIDELFAAMEAIMQAKYFSPDQLVRLKDRHREAGADAFAGWQRQGAELADEARHYAAQGTDPADPAAQALAHRWTELMVNMTGGDRKILSSIYAKMDGEGPDTATRGVVSAEAWEYMKRTFAVGFAAPG